MCGVDTVREVRAAPSVLRRPTSQHCVAWRPGHPGTMANNNRGHNTSIVCCCPRWHQAAPGEGECEDATSTKSRNLSAPVISDVEPALMAAWSKALPLTDSCLSPLRACPDGRVV